ncbi:MAG: beta-lactamase family protein [Clostridia bacterium]|nr:beta-lactamase family protein [Clostridia bacterium]
MERLDRAIREYCEREQIGGVLRCARGDEVLYEASFGLANRETGEAFCPESVFHSMTKPFCAIGFLRLVERGLVSLSDHPSKVIGEMAGVHPRLCFHHLLRHVSGLADPVQDGLFPEDTPSFSSEELRVLLPLVAKAPMHFEPGTAARYCNINFVLCAIAIENLTGMPFWDYMKREILDPLEMTALSDRPGLIPPHRVQGYELRDGALVPVERSYRWMLGAGDLLGRLSDAVTLARITRERLLLKNETWDTLVTPSPLNGMGMGCTVKPFYNKAQIRHNGGASGFRTLHVYLPEEDFDFILLSNSGFGNARRDIAAMINRHFFGSTRGVDDAVMDAGYATP